MYANVISKIFLSDKTVPLERGDIVNMYMEPEMDIHDLYTNIVSIISSAN